MTGRQRKYSNWLDAESWGDIMRQRMTQVSDTSKSLAMATGQELDSWGLLEWCYVRIRRLVKLGTLFHQPPGANCVW